MSPGLLVAANAVSGKADREGEPTCPAQRVAAIAAARWVGSFSLLVFLGQHWQPQVSQELWWEVMSKNLGHWQDRGWQAQFWGWGGSVGQSGLVGNSVPDVEWWGGGCCRGWWPDPGQLRRWSGTAGPIQGAASLIWAGQGGRGRMLY